jgi:hypothetical protein
MSEYTEADVPGLACEDCPAVMHLSRGVGVGGPVLTVVVEHEPSCPWLARVAPNGATISTEAGILMHVARHADGEPQ